MRTIVAIVLVVATALRADEVELKNGSVFSGAILEETESAVTLRAPGGTMTFAKKDIVRVSRDEHEAEAPNPGPAADGGAAVDRFLQSVLDHDMDGLWGMLGQAARERWEKVARDVTFREGFDTTAKEVLSGSLRAAGESLADAGGISAAHVTASRVDQRPVALITFPNGERWRVDFAEETGSTVIAALDGPKASLPREPAAEALNDIQAVERTMHELKPLLEKIVPEWAKGVKEAPYWTRDVAGFHAYAKAWGHDVERLLTLEATRADRLGLAEEARPYHGYWLRSLARDGSGQPYARIDFDHDGRADGNDSRFGFCAYPAEYGKTGTMTFITDESGALWQKDLGATVSEGAEAWPGEDPSREGWSRVK